MTEIPDIKPALSVSELNQQAKTLLESHFDSVRVEGEISDFTAATSGHWYFSLKDADAQVRCAMFRSANARVRFRPVKGDQVQVRGRVSLYANRGEFQLITQHMQKAGDGALQQAFDTLKAKLMAEGLFDAERKNPVPDDARRVGVITSAKGAALHDIISVIERRSPMTQLFLFPVPVQGTEATLALINALRQANDLHQKGILPLDVLIMGRGGGSAEDLWAFNDEELARSIVESVLPVVSAVGHEVDFSISDFVADRRAATPSAAAELVTLDTTEWSQRLDDAQRFLQRLMRRRLNLVRDTVGHLRARLRHPGLNVTQQRAVLGSHAGRLNTLIGGQLGKDRAALDNLAHRLRSHHPRHDIAQLRGTLDSQTQRLGQGMTRVLRHLANELAQKEQLIRTLGPENTLARGYALVTTTDGRIVRSADNALTDAEINVRLASGSLTADVTSVTPASDGD